jgi:hypothetical protein
MYIILNTVLFDNDRNPMYVRRKPYSIRAPARVGRASSIHTVFTLARASEKHTAWAGADGSSSIAVNTASIRRGYLLDLTWLPNRAASVSGVACAGRERGTPPPPALICTVAHPYALGLRTVNAGGINQKRPTKRWTYIW